MSKKGNMYELAQSSTYDRLLDRSKMTKRRWRMLGMMYLAWKLNRIALYPLLCLPAAVPFHSSYKSLLALFGGNRSSKTYSAAAEVVMVATGQHFFKHPATMPKPPFQIWVMTEDFKTAWDVQLQAILFWLPPNLVRDIRWSGSTHELRLTRPDGEVTIQFRSWTQGFKRQRGRFVQLIWFDEEPEDEDVFREMEFRTLGSGTGRIMISCTPQSGTLSYLYDRMIENESEDEEVDYWYLNAYDNFYIDQETLARLDKHAIGDDEADRDMRIKGMFAIRTGRVFKNYVDEYYDEEECPEGCLVSPNMEIPRWWERWRSVDPGYEVCAVGWYAIEPGTGHCYKYREATFKNMAMSDSAKEICRMSGDEIYANTVVDGSDPGAARELNLCGIKTILDRDFAENLKDIPENSRKRAGIERLRYYFSGAFGPRLFLFSDCVDTRKEIVRHAYNSSGEPEKVNDHHIDETRYFISSRPKAKNPLYAEVGQGPTMRQLLEQMEAVKHNPFNIIGGHDTVNTSAL